MNDVVGYIFYNMKQQSKVNRNFTIFAVAITTYIVVSERNRKEQMKKLTEEMRREHKRDD